MIQIIVSRCIKSIQVSTFIHRSIDPYLTWCTSLCFLLFPLTFIPKRVLWRCHPKISPPPLQSFAVAEAADKLENWTSDTPVELRDTPSTASPASRLGSGLKRVPVCASVKQSVSDLFLLLGERNRVKMCQKTCQVFVRCQQLHTLMQNCTTLRVNTIN
jgi:hypothetical protein